MKPEEVRVFPGGGKNAAIAVCSTYMKKFASRFPSRSC